MPECDIYQISDGECQVLQVFIYQLLDSLYLFARVLTGHNPSTECDLAARRPYRYSNLTCLSAVSG